MEKTAAVVVTYNRLPLLQKCIQSLREQVRQVDKIIVVNNGSTDTTLKWLSGQQDLLVFNQLNLGGAGGFATGMFEAYEFGYDWIWIMDDDCIADPFCLQDMFLSFDRSDNVLCIAPVVLDSKGKPDYRHRGNFTVHNNNEIVQPIDLKVLEKDLLVDFASFVGLMIKADIIKKIGLPKKELFIHFDDVEFCLRLNRIGKILVSSKAKILHLETAVNLNVKKSFLMFRNERVPIDRLWIKYYGVRNLIWIRRNYFCSSSWIDKLKLSYILIKSLLKHFQEIIFYDDLKIKRISFYTNAYLDGWRGKFENDKPKKILYES